MLTRLRARGDVGLISGAVGISALGDFLVWVPLTLHLQATTGSGIAVAALFIALWSPVVLLAPFAGLLVDRVEARTLLIAASVAQALVAVALGFALDSTAAILVLAALLGVGFSISQPSEFSLVPVIGRGSELTKVNGYVETARYAGMAAGPLIGGVLAGMGGTQAAMFVNAGTFLAVAVAGLLLTARRPGTRAVAEAGERDRARDGIVHLFRDRTLGLVMWVLFVSLLFMTASATAEVFFIVEDLGLTGALYGVVLGSWILGMVVGALVVSRRIPARMIVLVTLASTGVQSIGLGLPTVWLAAGFAAAMWFVGGVGHGTKNVLARTLIQERVPERLHGRAFAAYNGLRNGAELFALAGGGLLVAALGGRVTLALAGGIPVLAVVAGLLVYRSRRDQTGPGTVAPAAA